MRYPTLVNNIETNLSPIVNLVNKVLDLSGSNFSASNIEYNPQTMRELVISTPGSCTMESSIRIDGNRSTELKKTGELFMYDSAVIKNVIPALPQDTTLKLLNVPIEFTNPRINIPTSVITTTLPNLTIQGIINTVASISITTTQITNMIPGLTSWQCTVGSTAGFLVNSIVQIENVDSSSPISPILLTPFNTNSVITARITAIPNSTTLEILYTGTNSVNPPGPPFPILTPTSQIIQRRVSITDAFINLPELNITISSGKAIPDLSGASAPALVSANDDSLYFAYISRYSSNLAYLGYRDAKYDIVIGHLFPDGTVDWIHRPSGLVTTREESTPVLVIGDQNDLYLAYMTTGSTSGNLNGIEIFLDTSTYGICGCADPSSCTLCGYEDIVLAKINPTGASQSVPPTIVWKVQGGHINSIYREINPSICVDTANKLVYLAYQSNKNLACFTATGTSNILLHCFTMTGKHLWVKAQTEINSAGANTNPSIACDNLGNVYVAYEIKAPASESVGVDGGALIPENQKQIEVVRFQTVFSSPNTFNTYNSTTTYVYGTWVYYAPTGLWYVVQAASVQNEPPLPASSKWSESYVNKVDYVQRVWVLSESINIFAVDGIDGDNCSQPSIVADPTNGNIFLAFLTTGRIMNSTQPSSIHELVVISFTNTKIVRWIRDGTHFNPETIVYNDCSSPHLMMDRYGNLLFSLLTTLESGKSNMAIFNYDQDGETRWNYPRSETETYPVYMWSRTNSPNSVFPDSPYGSFSKIGIGKSYSNIFLGTVTDLLVGGQIQVGLAGITNMLCISRFNENIYFKDRNAFSYMIDIRSICACGKENCGCF